MRMVVVFLVIGILLIAGCAPQQVDTSSELTKEAGDSSTIEQADQDLNTSELNGLDGELDDLSW